MKILIGKNKIKTLQPYFFLFPYPTVEKCSRCKPFIASLILTQCPTKLIFCHIWLYLTNISIFVHFLQSFLQPATFHFSSLHFLFSFHSIWFVYNKMFLQILLLCLPAFLWFQFCLFCRENFHFSKLFSSFTANIQIFHSSDNFS